MLQMILPALLGKLGEAIIDKVFPNTADAAKAKLELLKMEQSGALAQIVAESKIAQGQLIVNKEEAKSESLFKSGWRPAVGWVCVIGLIYNTVGAAAFNVALVACGLPPLALSDTTTLITLLFGMLGLGYYRTKEKLTK